MTGPRAPSWGGYFSKLPHGYFDWEPVLEVGDLAALMLLKMSDYAHPGHSQLIT